MMQKIIQRLLGLSLLCCFLMPISISHASALSDIAGNYQIDNQTLISEMINFIGEDVSYIQADEKTHLTLSEQGDFTLQLRLQDIDQDLPLEKFSFQSQIEATDTDNQYRLKLDDYILTFGLPADKVYAYFNEDMDEDFPEIDSVDDLVKVMELGLFLEQDSWSEVESLLINKAMAQLEEQDGWLYFALDRDWIAEMYAVVQAEDSDMPDLELIEHLLVFIPIHIEKLADDQALKLAMDTSMFEDDGQGFSLTFSEE